jgi:lycopene cyclase domain-containing protein
VHHLIYLALLAGCLLATAPLEIVIGARVWRRPLRLVLTLLPVVVLFTAWDLYAISRHHWSYDKAQTSGVLLPGRLPLEELLFFVVIPICSILTLEAVRTVRGWPVDDESGG